MTANVGGRNTSLHDNARVRSLPIDLWPAADRDRWIIACVPRKRLKRGGRAGHLSAITQDDLQRRVGYYFDFLNRRGELDLAAAAGSQMTSCNVDSYVEELTARVGSVTVHGSIAKLRWFTKLVAAELDLQWLQDLENDLTLVMQPKSKAGRFVLTEVLVKGHVFIVSP